MPLQQTSGAASYDAFGGGAPVAAKYIEDFFQPWLRTGTGSSTTVTTGLNASINKSLVWTKSRSAATNHKLTDNARGVTKALSSNTTDAEVTDSQGLTAFGSTGYTIGTNTDYNNSGATYVDWQWVATPKFFDVVTYTTVSGAMTIPHNLGAVPGCWIIKSTNATGSWWVQHRSIPGELLRLNGTSAVEPGFSTATSTNITISNGVYSPGTQIVIYLFAHNAGGFGLSGTDNVISCGSFNPTSNGSVDLGYEPQWIIAKKATGTGGSWFMWDSMRGWPAGRDVSGQVLRANETNAEAATSGIAPTATGFDYAALGDTWIYIAIRRGPMKVPTTGTSVYNGIARSGTGAAATVNGVGFAPDLAFASLRASFGAESGKFDKLRGVSRYLVTNSAVAEATDGSLLSFDMDGITLGATSTSYINGGGGYTYINHFFKRAPGFLDEVCYTGTGVARTVAHNLGVAPELIIAKCRSAAFEWTVYSATLGNSYPLFINGTSAGTTNYGSLMWGSSAPTATQFPVGTYTGTNANGATYVAYLFASCPGVSKVGSYIGTGTTQTINCGFTGGARFVMVKRTDSTGNWMVVDTARGLVAAGDPTVYLNSAAAEVTGVDWLDPDSSGFIVNQEGTMNANVNAATYIYLAIA